MIDLYIYTLMNFVGELPSLFQYHKTTRQLNLQAITVWATKERFVIVPNFNRSRIPTILQIDRSTKIVKQHAQLHEESYNQGTPHFFSCLIGIIDLSGKKIMLLAQEVNIVGSIGHRDIFKVTKPIYLFYNQQQKKNLTQKEAEILLSITAIFQQGMYFSFTYDLASRLKVQKTYEEVKNTFNWAYGLQKQLTKFDSMWRISVIQGFVGRLEVHINGLKLFIVLISRRAIKRGGTQSYARGIDIQGNTGNYIQSEQIMIIKDHYFSFLQVRGSAPFFWKQENSAYGFSTVKCFGNAQQNYIAFKKHLKLISEQGQFKDVFLLNLMASSKEQKKLVENYEFLVRQLSKQIEVDTSSIVRYAYFDLHSQCANKQYCKLNQFLEQRLKQAVAHCKFTALKINSVEKSVQKITSQTGVFRTNCFNCIDRTNIAQSRIAALKLIEILKFLEIQIKQLAQNLAFFSYNSQFSKLYRNLWADNADALSKQYTGTGSTESLAVRKGKLSYLATLDHGMKSISRAIRNIRNQDDKKQFGISFILNGKMPPEGDQTRSKQQNGGQNGPEKYDQMKQLSQIWKQ